MKYSPLLTQLAQLPWQVTGLREADNQHKKHHLLLLSQSREQWIIDTEEKGGLYAVPVYHWHNPLTRQQGYGTLELLAAMRQTTLEGENLRFLCKEMVETMCEEGVAERFPELMAKDYRTLADHPQDVMTVEGVAADFSPQELYALGCKCLPQADGTVRYSFSPDNLNAEGQFQPSQIISDFNIRPLLRVTLPAKEMDGVMVSETIYSTPWNPMFVCFADKSLQSGCVFRPAMDEMPMPFSNDPDVSLRKVSGWMGGDKIFVYAMSEANSTDTGFIRSINHFQVKEPYLDTKIVWEEEDGKMKRTEVVMDPEECKADNIIYCLTPQDAVAVYYHLNSLHYSYPNSQEQRGHYHVAFHYGLCDMTKSHHHKLRRFARKLYTSYPNSLRATRYARTISRKFRDVYRISLPDTFQDIAHRSHNRLYCRVVNSVRDFFLCYRMTREEASKYDGSVALLYQRQMNAALNTMVFEKKEKRDKNGQVQEEFFVVNSANVCEYLAGEGFARDVDPLSTDKIGRYVHLEGVFADEIDPKSMLVVARESLAELAKDTARTGTDDYEKMLKAITLATREVNEATINKLPSLALDYKSSYGRHLQHFFYQNGALRITPDSIEFLPYDKLRFNVDRREILPWNFSLPFKTAANDQFKIEQNPDYVEREQKLHDEAHQLKDGVPVYTSQEMAQKRSELMQWGSIHQWKVTFSKSQPRELWGPLQVLRGFANVHWEEEEECLREGRQLPQDKLDEVNAHFANIIFAIGRALWRWRSSQSNSALYLTEDAVADERKATGGSGKSSLVNVFMACSVNVLKIDGKNIRPGQNTAMLLAQFVEHQHGLIHWEDLNKGVDLKSIYNYITSGFTYERKFIDAKSLGLNESPGHIITSNYSPTDLDDSSMRRTVMVPFSNRFCGENPISNTPARLITDVMPRFSPNGPEDLSTADRNQIAWINAKAVQFLMRYDRRVNAPQQNIKHRVLVRTLGDTFVAWAQSFFSQEQVYGFPVCLKSCCNEYISDFADPSENRKGDYSLKKFREKVRDYISTIGVVMNPDQLFVPGSKAEGTRYFAMKAWVRHTYFEGREWETDDTVEVKTIRVKEQSQNVVFFYRKSDPVPPDYSALKRAAAESLEMLDPLPVKDADGNIVTLTDEEKQRLQRSNARKQGSTLMAGGAEKAANATDVYSKEKEDMPF